jgi:hypothetical protein
MSTTSTTTKKVSLKKLAEFNTVWHEESGLVFKSQKEIIVIGKLVNKEIVPLTAVDVTTCEKFKFKYEMPVADEEEEVEEVEGEEEVEEGEGTEEAEDVASAEGEEEEAEAEPEPEQPKVVEEVKKVAEETVKTEEAPKEIVKPITAEDNDIDSEIDEFNKIINDLNRIWKTTNAKNDTRIHALEIELQETKKDLFDLQDLYDKMKVKFDGIKQLFSL